MSICERDPLTGLHRYEFFQKLVQHEVARVQFLLSKGAAPNVKAVNERRGNLS